jgi:hypothetical protein
MKSVLLIVEPEDAVHHGVNRALMLARYLNARIDILLYDDEYMHARSDPDSQTPGEEAREYLEALRQSVRAPDIEISTHVYFGESLREQLTSRFTQHGVDLIIKSPERDDPVRDKRQAWRLLSVCPTPLLLTRGQPWHPHPRFAAAISAVDRSTETLSLLAARAVASLREACGASLDLIYDSTNADSASADGAAPARLKLDRLAHRLRFKPRGVRLPTGDPTETLPGFVADEAYDLLAIGYQDYRHEPSLSTFGASLAGQLIGFGRCDLLFVKEPGHKR